VLVLAESKQEKGMTKPDQARTLETQCSTKLDDIKHDEATQHTTPPTTQYNTKHHTTAQHNTKHHTTPQHNTTQRNTKQHNTNRHSTR
jgi:hypothetical protein